MVIFYYKFHITCADACMCVFTNYYTFYSRSCSLPGHQKLVCFSLLRMYTIYSFHTISLSSFWKKHSFHSTYNISLSAFIVTLIVSNFTFCNPKVLEEKKKREKCPKILYFKRMRLIWWGKKSVYACVRETTMAHTTRLLTTTNHCHTPSRQRYLIN